MDDWEKFNETSIPGKEDFYSHINMENITDADFAHIKKKNLQRMLLTVEKDIREGVCHSIYRYAKANNKYMNN